jgi:hypothetical protein
MTRGQGAGLLKAANDLASEVLASANGLNNNRLPQAHSGVTRGRMPGRVGHVRATPCPTGILLPPGNFVNWATTPPLSGLIDKKYLDDH